MSSNLVDKLASEMINYELPDVAVIFAGVDKTGPHLYIANNGDVACVDQVGFAAVGAGSWHVNSQFMLAKHTRDSSAVKTLSLTYAAKKRAEVAPGVGTGTDMFSIGPSLGSYSTIRPEFIDGIEKIYRRSEIKTKKILEDSKGEINEYLQKITAEMSTETQVVKETASGRESTNKKNVRAATKKG
jgi:hypothetical protein